MSPTLVVYRGKTIKTDQGRNGQTTTPQTVSSLEECMHLCFRAKCAGFSIKDNQATVNNRQVNIATLPGQGSYVCLLASSESPEFQTDSSSTFYMISKRKHSEQLQ